MGLEGGAGRAGGPRAALSWQNQPLLVPVGSVVPDPRADRDAAIPALLRVVPQSKAHSQSPHEPNWGEHTLQWVAASSPLTQSSFHCIPLLIYFWSFTAAWLMDGVCTCSSYPEHGALQPLLYLL